MRATEHLLRAFAVGAEVSPANSIPLEYEMWDKIIRSAAKNIDVWLNSQKRGPLKQTASGVLTDSVADFNAFKNSVRNDLMHARSGLLDEPTTVGILNRVKACFDRLEPYLSEDQDESILEKSLWSDDGR